MSTRGWHRILNGWYRYSNAAGKELAQVYRYRSFWNVTIFPMGDAARQVELPGSPKTYREAKALAEEQYRILTAAAIRENARILKLHGHTK